MGTATPLPRGWAAKGKRIWKFVVGGRDDGYYVVENIETVGRSGTERS